MDLFSTRFLCSKYFLNQFSLLEIKGTDAEKFLQKQLSNDVLKLENKKGQISARLTKEGRIHYFLILGKFDKSFYILVLPEFKNTIKENLENYVISEDVEFHDVSKNLYLIFNNHILESPKEYLFEFEYCGLSAFLVIRDENDIENIIEANLESLRTLSGFPKWGFDIDSNFLVNNTILNNLAMSYTKGCFLGLETASKIQNNRGAAFYPMIIEVENQIDLNLTSSTDINVVGEKIGVITHFLNNLFFVNLSREFRVENLQVKFTVLEREFFGVVKSLPYFKSLTYEEKSMEIFYEGLKYFHQNDFIKAFFYFELSLKYNPKNSEVIESFGVVKGQLGNYEEAINWMDKLLEVEPNSVMAHTNKSLFLMKLGKIEEAENEKSLATVKSFAKNGEEFAIKKAIAEENQKKEQRLLKNEKMFLEVLEIDPEDTMALFGLADIYFTNKNIESALNLSRKVYDLDNKNYKALYLIGKCYEIKNDSTNAIESFKLAMGLASKSGNFSMANEIQLKIIKSI